MDDRRQAARQAMVGRSKWDLETPALCKQASHRHLLIDSTPKRLEGSEGWKRQHHLAAGFQMSRQSLNGMESVRAKEHHGQIAGNAIIEGKICRQRAKVGTLEAQPGKLSPLDRPCASSLAGTHVNAQHLAAGTDLLGHIEGRDTVPTCDIEHRRAGKQIKMPQQRLGERRGPIIVVRKRPTDCHGMFSVQCDAEAGYRRDPRPVKTTASADGNMSR